MIRQKYLKLLHWSLKHRSKTIIGVVVILLLSLSMLFFIGTEFMPEQDIPFMMMNVKMPVGTPLEETDLVIRQLEDIFGEIDDVRHVMALVGPMVDEQAMADPTNPQNVNEAQIYVRIYEKQDRKYDYEEIKNMIRKKIPKIKDAEFIFMSRDEMMGGGQADPIELSLYGKDLTRLRNYAAEIEKIMMDTGVLADITNSMREGKPEARIRINKDKAYRHGLTSYQIASVVKTASLGTIAGIFREEGEEIDILVRVEEEKRDSFSDILNIGITSPFGYTIPLNQVAWIEFSEGPKLITREKQTRKVTLGAQIKGTSDVGGTVRKLRTDLSDLEDRLPPGYFITYGGSYEDMIEAFIALSLALLLAVILVYTVMASQFESFKQPFIVMFTMPLAIVGVLLMLVATGTTLSIASFVGGIILAGIVVNNGIVLIDHINQLRQSGMDKFKAIIQAGSDRMRPVLITASTTILGMLPMAISSQEGSELKSPMALTVIGGLITATFFTLIVIPVIYSLMIKDKE
jgi:HAE1 family hydrophobic/amphiphilic exporter-1